MQLGAIQDNITHDIIVDKFGLVLAISTKHDLLPSPQKELPQLHQASDQAFALTTWPTQYDQPINKAPILHSERLLHDPLL
jgi:hypothetical protein